MKTFVMLLTLAGIMLWSVGCTSSVAYSGRERGQLISRSISYEGAQLQDDIDAVLLLRPPSRMTIWHVR